MDQLKKDSKEIDGITVKTQQFAAMRGCQLMMKLIKTIGPALGLLMKLDPNTKLDQLGSESMAAFAGLDDEAAAALIPQILAGTTASTPDGRHLLLDNKSNIDSVFSGRSLKTLFASIGFALQVNYRDFG